jgi:hypothetical protein
MIAMTTLQKFESDQLAKLVANAKIPEFAPGDTVKVNVKVGVDHEDSLAGIVVLIHIGADGGGAVSVAAASDRLRPAGTPDYGVAGTSIDQQRVGS